jgi:hypothetical protein
VFKCSLTCAIAWASGLVDSFRGNRGGASHHRSLEVSDASEDTVAAGGVSQGRGLRTDTRYVMVNQQSKGLSHAICKYPLRLTSASAE